jgi:hypothetical protein
MESKHSKENNIQSNSYQKKFEVFIYLKKPWEKNQKLLLQQLKQEDLEGYPVGIDEVTVILTEEEIQGLFNAHIKYSYTGASASDTMIHEPFLENVTIPKRYEKIIEDVYLDLQR